MAQTHHSNSTTANGGQNPNTQTNKSGDEENFTSSFTQRGAEAMRSVGEKAREVTDQVTERTDEALSSLGSGISRLGGTIRQNAPESVASAASQVADKLESSGRYLQDHSVEDLAGEVGGAIRRNPIASMCIGVGVGLLLGKMFTRSSRGS